MGRIVLIFVVAASLIVKPGDTAGAASLAGSGCTIKIFFNQAATSAQIVAVKSRLRRDSQVKSFRFLTRQQALDEMRKKFPDLTDALTSNPLPAEIRVQPKAGVSRERFVSRYERLRLTGVQSVKDIAPSGLSCRFG